MHLKQAEGTVAVSDAAGKDIPLLKNLGLYSGYGVNTRPASFAWIDLDDVKLTKMDEESENAILKEDKLLEIEVKSGSLFFNVNEPLEEDETMNIHTSTMLAGIQGACGRVEVPDPAHMNLYLLEGTVECTAGANAATVQAGEMAVMTEDGEITVEKFSQAEIFTFVAVEIEGDDNLAEVIADGSGTGVTGGPGNPPDKYRNTLKELQKMEKSCIQRWLTLRRTEIRSFLCFTPGIKNPISKRDMKEGKSYLPFRSTGPDPMGLTICILVHHNWVTEKNSHWPDTVTELLWGSIA